MSGFSFKGTPKEPGTHTMIQLATTTAWQLSTSGGHTVPTPEFAMPVKTLLTLQMSSSSRPRRVC